MFNRLQWAAGWKWKARKAPTEKERRIQETRIKMNSRRCGVISVIMIFYGLNECFAVVTNSPNESYIEIQEDDSPKIKSFINQFLKYEDG